MKIKNMPSGPLMVNTYLVYDEIEKKVADLIKRLGLEGCQSTRIGS